MVDYDRLPAASKHFRGKLYQKMNEDLQLAGFAKRTVHGYLRAVRQLADYCNKSPDGISEAELRRFFLYLKNEREFAYGSLRVAFSGIKFFFSRTCKRSWETLAVMKLQHAKTLPTVMTVDEVHRVIDACRPRRSTGSASTGRLIGTRVSSFPPKAATTANPPPLPHRFRPARSRRRSARLPLG